MENTLRFSAVPWGSKACNSVSGDGLKPKWHQFITATSTPIPAENDSQPLGSPSAPCRMLGVRRDCELAGHSRDLNEERGERPVLAEVGRIFQP